MHKRSFLVLLSVSSPLLLIALLVDSSVTEWLAALLVTSLPVLLIGALGWRPPRGRGLLLLWLLLAGSMLALMGFSAVRDLASPTAVEIGAILGLMLGGLALLPLALVGWLHGRSFCSRGLAPQDLRRWRQGPGE